VDRKRLTAELERLYRTEYPSFLRVAIAVTGDEAAAHDAVQEGFARALKSLRTFRAAGTLEAWVWQIVVNAARSVRSEHGGTRLVPEDAAFVTANGSDAGVDATVRTWVAALPERQRLVVFLRYYAGLDYRAIAAALGIEVGTVSATLSSAHATLRRSLKEVSR
jgi:RNA polymerase sigma factor (sigma-70 family)